MTTALRGRKFLGGSSDKPTRHDDSLFGQDTVELLLALSEGPIKGLKDGASTFFVGDVPLLDKSTNTPNISNFELRLLKGTNPADSIRLNLGGLAFPTNVGLDLRAKDQLIVVQGTKPQIDYIDLRFAVQRLLSVTEEGDEYPTDIKLKVEVKPRSSSVWAIPFSNQKPPSYEDSVGTAAFRPDSRTAGVVVNGAYRETYLQATPPLAAKQVGAMWFNTSTSKWTPRIWDGTTWVVPTNLVGAQQGDFYTWKWKDNNGTARTAWHSPSGIVPPAGTLAKNDFLLTPQSGEQVYSYNDTAWVGFQNWNTAATAAPGMLAINGLARSTYPKEFRIPVARINEPYDIRVTRISDATTKSIFRDISFEGIQEVNRDAVTFNDLAVIWLTIKATDTFTSIPDFTGIYQGLVIPVPSNYTFEESTQTGKYTGVWDGTFKMAYTNNPAWHAYNFIMNSRYGKNAYYPEVADKIDFYEFGKHCDLHAFRFNEYITEPRSLNELINYVVGTAGGRYVDRGDGYSTVLWDADDQPALAIFAPENTIDGAFTYSFTDITERKNDFKVSFKNPALNYREDRVRVYDQPTIDAVGRNAEEFVAVGCRDADEAVRRGRMRIATSLTEKTIVNFKTNRLGRYLLPFQVILVSDPDSSNVITGRVASPDGTPAGVVVLPLRDQIYLEAGVSYSAQFTVSDGNGGVQVVSYPLTVASPGLQSQLRLSRALTDPLPEYAVFSIGAPKPFRITGISQADEDPDVIDITAMEVNRLKWAFVDGEVTLRDLLGKQTGALSKFVYPPTNAAIQPEITAKKQFNLLVTWNPSETKLIRHYRVYVSLNGEEMDVEGEPKATQFRIKNARQGTYLVSIVAVGLDGRTESAPVTVQYIVSNETSMRSVKAPSNLRLVNEPNSPFFQAINPQFAWDASEDPLIEAYRVEVLAPDRTVVNTRRVTGLNFQYALQQNKLDNGNKPLRTFTVRVRSIDTKGNFSEAVELPVMHPAPPAIVPTANVTGNQAIIKWTRPVPDVEGALIWLEQTSGYDPATKAPKADSISSPEWLPVKVNSFYYLRVALYDSYGKTDLNYSPEVIVDTSELLFDPTDPGIPQNVVLTTVTEVDDLGRVTGKVSAAWDAITASNLLWYEVSVAESLVGDPTPGDGAFVGGFIVNTNSWSRSGFRPGQRVHVRVRSISKSTFGRSGWSPIKTIQAAKNLTPPQAATNLKVTPGFERAYLTWTNPADTDLGSIRVYGGASTTFSEAVQLGTVAAPGNTFQDVLAAGSSRYYWVQPANTSVVAGPTTGPVQATSAALKAEQIGAGILDASKFASSIAAIEIVASIPSNTDPKNFDGRTVYSIADKKTLRFDAAQNKFVALASADAADLTGQIAIGQIKTDPTFFNTVSAGVLVAGAIRTDMVAANAITGKQLAIASANLCFNADVLQSSKVKNLNASGAIVSEGPGDVILGWPLEAISPGTGFTSVGATAGAGLTPRITVDSATTPSGLEGVRLQGVGTATADGQLVLVNLNPASAGGYRHYPVVPGQGYEFSSYLNGQNLASARVVLRWLNSSGAQVGSDILGSAVTTFVAGGQSLSAYGRSVIAPATGKSPLVTSAVAPAGAAFAMLMVRADYLSGAANPSVSATWTMYAPGYVGQLAAEASPFVAPGVTAIDGGVIAARSIYGISVIAGTITTDLLKAGAIDVKTIAATGSITTPLLAADVLTAENIKITAAGATLASWRNGANSTEINGGAIAANTVTANKVTVGNRGISTTGIEFSSPRVGDGGAATTLRWTGGKINYTADNGSMKTVTISAGSTSLGAGTIYVYWDRDSTVLTPTDDPSVAYDAAKPDRILACSVSDFYGISARFGTTAIDGTKISTRSIQADQIATDAVQARQIKAGEINTGHISTLGLDAKVINGGTINVSDAIYIGNPRTFITNDQYGGRFQTNYPGTGGVACVLGNLGPWLQGATDSQRQAAQGIIIWNSDGRQIINAGGYVTNSVTTDAIGVNQVKTSNIDSKAVTTVCIDDLAVTTGKINDLSVTRGKIALLAVDTAQIADAAIENAKINNLSVTNLKIADGAATQCVSNSTAQQEISVSITTRGSGKVVVYAFFDGNSGGGSKSSGVGALQILRRIGSSAQEARLKNVIASSWLNRASDGNYNVLNAMAIAVVDTPGTGSMTYIVRHTNDFGTGGVTIVVTELSK